MNNTQDVLKFQAVSRNQLPTYSELFQPLFVELDKLPETHALQVFVPTGKKALSFRNSLMNAAKKRGIKVSTASGPDNKTVFIWVTAGFKKGSSE